MPAPTKVVDTAAASRVFSTVKDAAQEVAEDVPELASKASKQVAVASKQLATQAERQLVAVRSIDQKQLLRALSAWANKAEQRVGETARFAQSRLSDGWTVVGVSLLLEFAVLALAIIPFAKELTIGPFEWWSRPWTPDTPWTIVSLSTTEVV